MMMTATAMEEVEVDVDYRPAVEAGGQLLTEYFRDERWVLDIDLEKLEMWGLHNCVLAQLFGGYFAGIRSLGWPDDPGASDYPDTYGFRVPLMPDMQIRMAHYDKLTATWKQYLIERREALGLAA